MDETLCFFQIDFENIIGLLYGNLLLKNLRDNDGGKLEKNSRQSHLKLSSS